MSDSKGRMPAVTVEMLQQNRLFHGVTSATLELLLRAIAPEVAQTGDWIIREGEVSDFMFVVLTGELEVVSHGGGPSADVRVALLRPRRLGRRDGACSRSCPARLRCAPWRRATCCA